MILIVFAVVAIIGQAINVMFCLAVESLVSSDWAGGLLFVGLYLFVFALAWKLSVYIVERIQGQPAEQPAPVLTPDRRQERRPLSQAGAR